MSFNYKTGFFIALGFFGLTAFLFLGYIIFTTFVFMDAGKSGLITSHDCADGDYCADNPANMPPGGWTQNNDGAVALPPIDGMPMPGSEMPGTKIDEDTLYQNIKFGFRFNIATDEAVIACPPAATDKVTVFTTDRMELESLMLEPGMECARDGSSEYISVDKSGEKLPTFTDYLNETYKYTTQKYIISGIEGTRYIGTKLPSDEGPSPDKIDTTILQTDEAVYYVTSDFYNRNVYIW
jgi:hypothetical protein